MNKIRHMGYWKNRKNLDRELNRVLTENNLSIIPSYKQMCNIGESALAYAIGKYYGGITAIRKESGEKSFIPGDYWTEPIVVKEIRRIKKINKWSSLPSAQILSQYGYNSVLHGIRKNGGIAYFRKIIGENQKRLKKSELKNKKLVLNQARKIMEQYNFIEFPSYKTLKELGYGGFVTRLNRYHDGILGLRAMLGESDLRKRKGFYDSWINVEKELSGIINKIGHFPTQKELRTTGNGSLCAYIASRYGGMGNVREKMGFKLDRVKYGYLQNWDNVRIELEKIIKDIGNFPTRTQFEELGRYSLRAALTKYHGGIAEVRKKMGYNDLSKDQLVTSLLEGYVAA